MLTINVERMKTHRWLPAIILSTLLALQGNPKAAIASPAIGINMNGAKDWNGDAIFADSMKSSRDWTDLTGGHAITLDANGWPQNDAQIYVWAGSPTNMAGSYALSFNGQATVAVVAGTGTITGQVYNSGTNTTTATLTMSNTDLNLRFTNTKRTSSSGTNTGVFNVKLMRPTVPGGSTPYASNVTFTTQEKALLGKFSTIRLMDYLCTNNSPIVNWSDRTLPTWASQQRFQGNTYSGANLGSALELAVQLCNETNKDMWVNIPYGATDAYVTNLAKTILYGTDGVNPYSSTQGSPVWPPLNAGLKVYIEWSNELWNYQFQQTVDNDNAAKAEVAAGGSPLNFDGSTSEFDWTAHRTAKRLTEISNDFRAVVGDAAMMTRFRPVLESQQGGGWMTSGQIHMLEDYYNNPTHVATPHPPSYYIYGGGGAAYYWPDNANTSLDINNIWTSQYFLTSAWAPVYVTAENDWDLPAYGRRFAYEGGPSMDGCNCSADAVKAQAWGDSRMTTLVTDHQTAWNQGGSDLLMYFNSVSDYRWGFTHDSSVLNTPKLAAIDQINSSAQAAATYGTVIPATIAAGSYGSPATWSGVNIANMAVSGNWEWTGYVVRNTSAGTFNIGLSAGSVGTTNQADVYIDGLFAGTITIPNSGANTTYLTSPTITTASLAVGSHGLLIKAKSGSFGMNSIIITSGSAPPPPPVPTGLTATAGNAQVALTWNASTGATAYDVKRSTTSGTGYATVSSPATTNYTNTGLTNGTTYYFVVDAKNASGTSANSAQASATPSAGGSTLLSQGMPATASSFQGTGFEPALAVDGNTTTRWSSGTLGAPYWIYVDLGATKSITRVLLNWEGAYGKDYTIQTSPDASTWTTIQTVTGNATAGVHDYTGLSGSGRYVRVNCTAVGPWPNISLYEFQVYGSAGGSAPAAPTNLTATPGNAQVALSWTASTGATSYNVKRSTVNGSGYATVASPTTTSYTNTGLTNGTTYYFVVTAVNASGESGNSNQASATPSSTAALLSQGKPATASSFQGTGFEASKAVDSDTTTRWSSGTLGAPYWIYVDLGATKSITRVLLNWEGAYGKDYTIQTSPDAATWTTIKTVTGNATAGILDYTGLSGSGRYVRVNCTAVGPWPNISLYEFQVYGF